MLLLTIILDDKDLADVSSVPLQLGLGLESLGHVTWTLVERRANL